MQGLPNDQVSVTLEYHTHLDYLFRNTLGDQYPHIAITIALVKHTCVWSCRDPVLGSTHPLCNLLVYLLISKQFYFLPIDQL